MRALEIGCYEVGERHTATKSAQAVRGTIPGNQGVGALGKAPQCAGEAWREEGNAAAVVMHQVGWGKAILNARLREAMAEKGVTADTAAPRWECQPGESSNTGDKWLTSGLARIGTTKHEDFEVPLVQGGGFDCGELVAQLVTAGGEPRLLLLRTKVGPAVRVVAMGAAGEGGFRPLREAEAGDTSVVGGVRGWGSGCEWKPREHPALPGSRHGKGQPG
jgi:hypothetical protein